MASTGARTLTLLGLLQRHRFWSGSDLADRLEVSERTLRRDIDRLRDLGYEITSVRGVAGGYQLAPGAALPPLALDGDEAVALAVGLYAVAGSARPEVADASVSALGKVIALLPAGLRARADAVQAVTDTGPAAFDHSEPTPQVLGQIAQACRDGVRLAFGYVAHGGEPSTRYVEPYRLVVVGRRWYLVAYDVDRRDWRTFRADRVSAPEPTRGTFTPRPLPADDLHQYVSTAIGAIRQTHRAVFDVELPGDSVRARLGRWAEVADRSASRCRVTMHGDSLDWPILALTTLDAEFVVVEPAELADRVATIADRFARARREATGRSAAHGGARVAAHHVPEPG